MKLKQPLHIHLSTLFIVMTLIVSGVIAAVGFRMAYRMLESSATALTDRASREIATEIDSIVKPAGLALSLLRLDPLAAAGDLETRWARLEVMRAALDATPSMNALYFGYDSGDFFLLQKVRSEEERLRLKAPERTRYILRSIERGDGNAYFMTHNLGLLRQQSLPDYGASYDPRKRGWYTQANGGADMITTPPYVFFSTGHAGITAAQRAVNGPAIIGLDLPLESLGAALHDLKVTPSSQLLLVNRDGQVIAHENINSLIKPAAEAGGQPRLATLDDLGQPALTGLVADLRADKEGKGFSLARESGGDTWRISTRPVHIDGGAPVFLVVAIPETELFAAAFEIRQTATLITVLVLLAAIPIIWLVARRISHSLRLLAVEAESIRHFEFTAPITLRSVIAEVDTLAETMDEMKRTIRRFTQITHAVAAEESFDKLLPMLLKESMLASGAAAGSLYLADQGLLQPCAAFARDGREVSPLLHTLPLVDTPPLIRTAVESQTAGSGEMQADERQAMALEAITDAEDGTQALQSVAVPLFNRQHELLGLMLLQRRTVIDSAQLAFVGTLSESASSSLETRALIRDQKILFEAFIQLIAGAIDTKSAYTGGHCARVPELTKMLARAACETTSGPYADFALNEAEWEAVHVAAWLHDCGKVTTPEYVVDKATKLETIYDRIHEVRMRFEVLKRDAEIRCLRDIGAGMPETEARTRMQEEQRRLDEDFAFIATCNEGGEYMAPEKIARLQQIAARTWVRTLDDRIGISHEEKQRKQREPAAPLPATEALLADRVEHRIERRASEKLSPGNKWGFQLKQPELLYNHGELHNLQVGRGTLSEEERYKINEHMVQTIIMLSALPFPRHLRNVPEIAGGHHEKMDGTGYPKGLKKEDMSPVARMMAIADIFEALTAADRPYKKGKALSESIGIMSRMKKDSHIDPELFELFLRSGVYREYAERHMAPELIDAVDIDKVLAA